MSVISWSSAQFSARRQPLVDEASKYPQNFSFDKSLALKRKFHDVIPGGSHTYAKGDDQFPEFMPPCIVRGKGCRVWDVDGNEFIEYGMGLRSVALGHAFEPIVTAAQKQMTFGANFGRPSLIELQ